MLKMQSLMGQMTNDMHQMVAKMHTMTIDINELRNHMADFEDFYRPLRSYLYWEKHCFDIPVCWSLRSVFDGLDGVDTMTDDIESLLPIMDHLDTVMPQLNALMPSMVENIKACRISRTSRRRTRTPWVRHSMHPRTTTRSTCRRKPSTMPNSKRA
jgi:RND superfamily putative drug exporter